MKMADGLQTQGEILMKGKILVWSYSILIDCSLIAKGKRATIQQKNPATS